MENNYPTRKSYNGIKKLLTARFWNREIWKFKKSHHYNIPPFRHSTKNYKVNYLRNTCCGILLIYSVVFFYSCDQKERHFELIKPSASNVDFNNLITESDSFNIITYEYIYNGGGVAIADFNNDGMQDIYFTGNMVNNKLYLNRGDFEFEDITEISKTGGANKWCSGVAVIDINNDGWKDLYVCATAHPDSSRRENILYINQGLDESGIPAFINKAAEYKINDNSHTTNAAFLDYDNDGDLDLFLVVNKMEESKKPNVYKRRSDETERVDKLFRNDWNNELNHPVFTDVSQVAGITYNGYGLGVNVTDLNQDGWKDIYVTNDFLTTDLTYINQKDGTFKNMSDDYFKHTSHSAMGNDVSDLNNDGYPDVVALDMMPEDNFRKKTMVPDNNYTTYFNNETFGYQYQYMRNTLQMNQGPGISQRKPVFSETGIFAGISSTDWSWAPLVADFDHDGLRDIIITNGFPRDVTDHDYVEFFSDVGPYASNTMLLSKMPSVKIKNYAYKNLRNGTFSDVTGAWGITTPSFSNGAAYGDLDNDGDLDYVVNNINDKAFIYKNLLNDAENPVNNWIKIKLKGSGKNPAGIGAVVKLYLGDEILYWDHSIYRGYLSSVDENIHFGLGKSSKIDSLIVYWPQGQCQRFVDVEANQYLEVDIKNANEIGSIARNRNFAFLFTDVSGRFLKYKHREKDYIDFNTQPLLPHKLSQYGPGIAIADVNADGLEDIFLGGSHYFKGTFLIQQGDGSFTAKDLLPGAGANDKKEEDLGVLFFDADGDKDQDLYIVSGGYEFDIEEGVYKDRLYENVDGAFLLNNNAIPPFRVSGSCVKGADYDRDGDIDLFVGGRVMPGRYPQPVSSYILENKSTGGNIAFEIANDKTAPELNDFGMACDALWTDFNNDGWVDLIVAGEWMPLRFFANEKGKLTEITQQTGIAGKVGWWNSLASADFDADGDMDYIAGNLGLSTFYEVTDKTPVSIYGADFDGNKGYDIIPTAFYKDTDGIYREFPLFGRLDVQKQIIKVKAQFLKHAEFGKATIADILNQAQRDSALTYRANYMSSSYIENLGDNRFSIKPLPAKCQVAPVYGMLTDDFNGDGNTDVLMVGNDFGTELTTGRLDAFNGLMLAGDGKGNFESLKLQQSGFYIPGDAKALASLISASGKQLIVGTQNRDHLRVYSIDRQHSPILELAPDDFKIKIVLEDGSEYLKEIYYGNTYLTHSSRKIILPKNATNAEITNYKGETRAVSAKTITLSAR